MTQLGQLHLQLTLMGARALSKNVEDQPRAVDNPALAQAFKITLLGGG